VLAVDDKTESGAVISLALQTRADLRTLVAYSGAEVIALLQAVTIDLLVVVHPLPTMSGIELLERAAYLGRRLSSIVIAKDPRDAAVTGAQQRGLVQFVISQPVRGDDLLLAIDLVLGIEAPTASR